MKKLFASVSAASLMAVGIAGPAAAQPPVITGGLVNVTIVDAVDVEDVNVGVGVAAGIAANVCGIDVTAAVLAQQVVRDGDTFTCTNELGDTTVTIDQR